MNYFRKFMLRISVVSYLNTLPFIYGINQSGFLSDFKLTLVPPATCAEHMQHGLADIALVPVGALPDLKDAKLVTDFCIGATQSVQSVLLLSQKPLKEIRSIGLDMQSRTSVALTQVLMKHFWKLDASIFNIDLLTTTLSALPDSIVCIGDKTFQLKDHFRYAYDLADEWKAFTGLPFVFACWVAHPNVNSTEIENLNQALQFGIKNISKSVHQFIENNTAPFDMDHYLNHSISFDLDASKQKAMRKFLDYL